MESTSAPQLTTGATQVAPRPAPPLRPLTAIPAPWPDEPYSDAAVDRALGAYGDRYDRPAAWNAFGRGPDGGSAA